MNSPLSSTPEHPEPILPLEELVWGDAHNLLAQFTFPELPTPANTRYLFQPGGTIFNALRQKGWTDPHGTPQRHFSLNLEEPHMDPQGQYHLRFHYSTEPDTPYQEASELEALHAKLAELKRPPSRLS